MPALPKMAALPDPPSVHTGPELDNRRIAAALIDLGVPLAFAALVVVLGLSLTLGLGLVAVGWTLYYFFALESDRGQTLGKRVMNLRVVSADGSPATMEQIAKRTVVRVLDGHVVGLIVMLASGERRQRLGDLVAGTVVAEAETVEAGVRGEPAGEPAEEDVHARGQARAASGASFIDRAFPSVARFLARRGGSGSLPEAVSASAQTSAAPPAPPPATDRPGEEPRSESMRFDPLAGPAPSVELDEPEPATHGSEPNVYGPGPASYGREPESNGPAPPSYGRESVFDELDPVVEVDVPELSAEHDRAPLVEIEADPSLPVELDSRLETRPDPAVDNGPMVAPGSAPDPELEVKPIETVSEIDLVMQDAEDRRRDAR